MILSYPVIFTNWPISYFLLLLDLAVNIQQNTFRTFLHRLNALLRSIVK